MTCEEMIDIEYRNNAKRRGELSESPTTHVRIRSKRGARTQSRNRDTINPNANDCSVLVRATKA